MVRITDRQSMLVPIMMDIFQAWKIDKRLF